MATTTHPLHSHDNELPEKELTYRELLLQSFMRGEISSKDFVSRYNIDLEEEAHLRALNGGNYDDVFDEECMKLEAPPSHFTTRKLIPYFAIEAAKRVRKESFARGLRTCGVCFCETPRQRSVFTSCGHVICRACAERLSLNAGYPGPQCRPTANCPFCREKSELLTLADGCDQIAQIQRNFSTAIKPSWEECIKRYLSGVMSEDQYFEMYATRLKADQLHRTNGLEYSVEYIQNIAISDAMTFWRKEKISIIEKCQAENLWRGRFHFRPCHCLVEEPSRRCAFTACGHVVCSECALKAQQMADNRSTFCPLCYKESGFVPLLEGAKPNSEKEE